MPIENKKPLSERQCGYLSGGMILQPTIVLKIELTARYCRDKSDNYCVYKTQGCYCALFRKSLNIGKESHDFLRLKECKMSEI